MKPTKRGDATGRPSWRSSLLGHPGAKVLWKKPSIVRKTTNRHAGTGRENEVFCFCFSSLSGARFAAARSGQGRAVFGRGGAYP